nr:MAG TPA: hypothetical protein [Caudoviricetes sp.]
MFTCQARIFNAIWHFYIGANHFAWIILVSTFGSLFFDDVILEYGSFTYIDIS